VFGVLRKNLRFVMDAESRKDIELTGKTETFKIQHQTISAGYNEPDDTFMEGWNVEILGIILAPFPKICSYLSALLPVVSSIGEIE
jgi:hypothetical protein